jgi:acyl-CoA thioesterase I
VVAVRVRRLAATGDKREGFKRPTYTAAREWTREVLAYTIRFEHPEKLITHLPIGPEVPEDLLAAIFRISLKDFRELRQRHRDRVAHAAEEIASDDRYRVLIEALPLRPGDVAVAYGDSITDDYQSWAYILERLLDTVRPADGVRILNVGVSGATSGDLLSRFPTVAAAKPSWIMVMIGTNDAVRPLGADGTLVSADETRRNMRALAGLIADTTCAELIWLSPPPVLPEQFASHSVARTEPIVLSPEDTERNIAAVLAQPELIVDTHRAFGTPPSAEYFIDGLHPSLAGQREIVKRLLEVWASGYAKAPVEPTAARSRSAPG